MNDLEIRADRAFRYALGASLSCCAPVGLIGLLQAFRIRADAEAAGQPLPKKIPITIFLGIVAWFELIGVFYAGYQHQQRIAEATQHVGARLEKTRGAATLTPATACDLVQERAIVDKQREYEHWTCPGSIKLEGDRATIAGVVGKQTGGGEDRYDACIVHGTRWFVLHTDASVPCPASLKDRPAGDDAAEARARDAFREQREAEAAAAFVARMTKVRDTLAHRAHAPTPCTLEGAPHEIGYVDFDLLNASRKADDDSWNFLSKRDLRDGLAPSAPVSALTRAALAGDPLLVVFSSVQRVWPEMIKEKGVFSDKYGFVSGRFAGWITVVDVRDASVRCEAPFAFENGDKVSFRKRGPSSADKRVDSALRDDLEDHFNEAAATAIKKLSSGKLKLGVKLLE